MASHTFNFTTKDHTKFPASAPPAFYFAVEIDGFPAIHAAFQEASGMEVSAELETISEAGRNEYSHRVPKRTSYNNLVLKRGLIVDDSAMFTWVKDTLQNGLNTKITPKKITVKLLDPKKTDGTAIKAWNFVNAYPVKWSLGSLNSTENALSVESIEFAYSYWSFA
jgi:phage tail-like protein